MKEQYLKYLIEQGYKQYTPSGNPSTIYSYIKAIERVMNWERIESWSDLAKVIQEICAKYDEGGEKEKLGMMSNKTVINALKRYQEFAMKKLLSELK